MNHREALLYELHEHGRTTYADLLRIYGKRGYTYRGFQAAVVWARQKGHVAPKGKSRRPVVIKRAACCPCCNRPYEERP